MVDIKKQFSPCAECSTPALLLTGVDGHLVCIDCYDKAGKRDHIDADEKFQSDKYVWSRPDFVPLKVADPMAQPVLWEYARQRRSVDPAFADDLQHRLLEFGYSPT